MDYNYKNSYFFLFIFVYSLLYLAQPQSLAIKHWNLEQSHHQPLLLPCPHEHYYPLLHLLTHPTGLELMQSRLACASYWPQSRNECDPTRL